MGRGRVDGMNIRVLRSYRKKKKKFLMGSRANIQIRHS